jgi:hypothetical protein
MNNREYMNHLVKEARLYLKGYPLYKEAVRNIEKHSSGFELENNVKYQLLKEKIQLINESFDIAVSDEFKVKAWDHFYYGLPLESHEEARYRKELAFWTRTLIEIAELDIFTK